MHKLFPADQHQMAISLTTAWTTCWKQDKAAHTTWTSMARQAEGKHLPLLKLLLMLSTYDAQVQDVAHCNTKSCLQGAEWSSQRQAAQAEAPQACDRKRVTAIRWRYTVSAV